MCWTKANLTGDKIPDYVFVSIKVWNGRYAGQSDVGVFVSNPQKKYTFNTFETRHLEAEVINGKIMLGKYVYSDDNENLRKMQLISSTNTAHWLLPSDEKKGWMTKISKN